ncbi:MAG: DUF1232 domain-containing protein [Deltaproteobacteria bacterium]|nr:DUF1232 domain-containing protein [Deltaproteobacteria bacterium]
MKVSFELSKRDIRFFRDRLKQVRASDASKDEEVVIRGAIDLVKEAIESKPPDFVVERIRTLEELIAMLRDDDWRLEGDDRARILDAIAYFVDPDDLIPDRIPGIGFLDDAIMIELVASELAHEIEAYRDFCEYRKGCRKAGGPAKLETRRKALQARMRRRSRNERSNRRSRGSSSSRIRLW